MRSLRVGTFQEPVIFHYNGDYEGTVKIVVKKSKVDYSEDGKHIIIYISMKDLDALMLEKFKSILINQIEQRENINQVLSAIIPMK